MAPVSRRLLAEFKAVQAQNELIIVYAVNRRRRRRRRTMWVREIFLSRALDRDFHNLFAKLRSGDTALFYNFVRMSPQQFADLPSLPDYPYNVRILTPLYGCTVDAKIFREACKNVVLRKFLAVFSRKFTVGLATLVRLIKTNCHRHHSVDRACDVRHVVLC